MCYTLSRLLAQAWSECLCWSDIIVAASMSGDMWPKGVRTHSDMRCFAKLIVGPNAAVSDLSQSKLPEIRKDTFLYVCPGGCAEGTPLGVLANCVPDMMDDLRQHAIAMNNSQRPQNAYETGGVDGDSWYDSAQLSKSRCTCKINFGGESRSSTRKNLNPDCQRWRTGKVFEAGFMGALQQNSDQSGVGDNIYMNKAFHVLLNRNRHDSNHRIGWHHDECADSYVPEDPITALSWGATGVLLIRAKENRETVKVLVSRPGDVYICGGAFQQIFEHAVPPIREWRDILDCHCSDMEEYEINAMEDELELLQAGDERVRYHINVRWHTKHQDTCTPHWRPDASVEASRSPSVVQIVKRVSAPRGSVTVSSMRPHPFFMLSTRQTATARHKVVKPCIGDTHTDNTCTSSASSFVVPTPAKRASTREAHVQTVVDMAEMDILQETVRDLTVVMAENFSNVQLLSTMLRICQLAPSDWQAIVDQQGLERCSEFLATMERSLEDFDLILDKLNAGCGNVGCGQYLDVIHNSFSTLHGMQSALSDRQCLQDALHRLKSYGCCMYETRVRPFDKQIKNQTWLRKYIMTHHDCEILMRHIHLQSLTEDGDIVWQMPYEWEFNVMQLDGSFEKVTLRINDRLYVCFLDIGLTADSDMHRLHLRTDPNRKERRRQFGEELASCLQESIVRCAAHVRLLDHERASLDRAAKKVAQGYYMHAWAACHDVRKEYLSRSKCEKKKAGSDIGQPPVESW